MTYDPVDTNDDGIVDVDVDNQSVSTATLELDDATYRSAVGSAVEENPPSGEASISVSGISENTQVFIEINATVGNNTDPLKLRFNNDSGANYDYEFEDQTGASGQTEVTLAEFSSQFSSVTGTIVLTNKFSTARAIGDCSLGGRVGRTSSLCDSLTWEKDEKVESVQLIAGGSGSTVSELQLNVSERELK